MAQKFSEAARSYSDDPTAFHLRAMNMLYEGLKQNATIVVVPSSVLDTMQLGVNPRATEQTNKEPKEKEIVEPQVRKAG